MNKELEKVNVNNTATAKGNYEGAKTSYQNYSSGAMLAGKPHSLDVLNKERNQAMAKARIKMDVSGMEYHIGNIQKSIEQVRDSVSKIESLKSESSGADWKTLNKDAYEALLDAEKDYFSKNIELLDKLNAHINFAFRKIVETDKELSQYLS